jgi:hypothetical protein
MGLARGDVAQEAILAAFIAHPKSNQFDPTNPPDYNATLQSQFETGRLLMMYLQSFSVARACMTRVSGRHQRSARP